MTPHSIGIIGPAGRRIGGRQGSADSVAHGIAA